MLNKEKHQLIMGQILKDIYTNVSIAPLLGLKGGTSAYFFYNLPRFSVDLDFDLFSGDHETQTHILETIRNIVMSYGTIKDSRVKRYTVFLLLSYGDADHNIKIEINTRMLLPNLKDFYDLKVHLGISVFASKPAYLFASKLSALTLRSETAMRDIYDIWYFSKNHWDINEEVIQALTGKTTKVYLPHCITLIEKVKDNQILHGLGELLSEADKHWVKINLRKDAIFMLKNYLSVLS